MEIIIDNNILNNFTVGFFVRQFTERGTKVATNDYAKYNEEILGNISYIICFTEKNKRS